MEGDEKTPMEEKQPKKKKYVPKAVEKKTGKLVLKKPNGDVVVKANGLNVHVKSFDLKNWKIIEE